MRYLKSGLACAVMLLTACGGGGSGGGSAGSSDAVASRGAITGFGSVIVNGVRYDTSNSAFEVDDDPGSQTDLAIGQIVTVVGTIDGNGNRRANRVIYDAELRGSITAIDSAAGTFVVAGQTVRVNGATIFEDTTDLSTLVVGDFVEVSGVRNELDEIEASFIEEEDQSAADFDDESELKGFVANLDTGAKTFDIGTQSVDYSAVSEFDPASLATSLVNGLFVEVEGDLVVGVLVARKVELEDDFDDAATGTEAEIEGLVTQVFADGFQVGSVRVFTSGATEFEGDPAEIAPGTEVEVEGSLNVDGSINASEVSIHRGESELAGIVESIDALTGVVSVLGISLSESTSTDYEDERSGVDPFSLDDLDVGDFVEIGFVEAADGSLEMQELERDESDADSLIRGALDSFNATSEQLVIAGVQINAASAVYQRGEVAITQQAFYDAVALGVEVKAEGAYSGTTLNAAEVELEGFDD